LGIGVGVAAAGQGVHLTDEQRIDWLRLIRSQNVGPRGIMAQTPEDFDPAIPTF
jgi:DprA-like N-terminal HHH domain